MLMLGDPEEVHRLDHFPQLLQILQPPLLTDHRSLAEVTSIVSSQVLLLFTEARVSFF